MMKEASAKSMTPGSTANPERAACLGTDAHGDANDVRAGHELAQGQRGGEFCLGQPTPPQPLRDGPARCRRRNQAATP